LRLERRRADVEHILEMVADLEPLEHRVGVLAGAVGENELAPLELRDRGAERRVRRQRRVVDLMHHLQKLIRLEAVLRHQPAHGCAVALVIILLQPERLVVGDFQEVRDVVANAHVDLLPEIEMMRVERVVEIENPGLDIGKTARGALIHSLKLKIIQPASRHVAAGTKPLSAPSCSRTGSRSPSMASASMLRASSSGFTVVLPIDFNVSHASSKAVSRTTSVWGSKELLWKPRTGTFLTAESAKLCDEVSRVCDAPDRFLI